MDNKQAKRAALSAFIGTTIEFYDFYIYATAAALALGYVFFPGHDPLMSTLAAFGPFAVGFIARPLAGIVFGHLGDKLCRRNMLLFTIAEQSSSALTDPLRLRKICTVVNTQ